MIIKIIILKITKKNMLKKKEALSTKYHLFVTFKTKKTHVLVKPQKWRIAIIGHQVINIINAVISIFYLKKKDPHKREMNVLL